MEKFNIIPLIEYFEKEVDPQDLIQVLDESISDCVGMACVRQDPVCSESMGRSVHHLKSLRNVILKSMGVLVFEPQQH